MNKKGFTLIELLAVITILGIIALIVVPSMDSIVKNSKVKVYEKQKDSLLSSLQEWHTDNKDLFYDNNNVILTLGDLKEQNYVDYDVRNPKTDKCISNDLTFNIEKNGKKYIYSIEGDELIDGTDNDCDVTKRFPSIYLAGTGVFNLEINTSYVEPGYSAKDMDDNNVTSSVGITNNIDNTKVGSYKVTYKVTVNGLTRTKVRKVNVVDTTKPVIVLPDDTISNTEIDVFNLLEGVTITDNSGETIIPKVKSNLSLGINGIYEIIYVAIDSNGNTTSSTRTITIDTKNPIISVMVSGKVASISMSDNIGIVGYKITNDANTPSNWDSVDSTRESKVDYTSTQAGTYYVHTIDAVGNKNKKSFTIDQTAFCAYEPGQTWDFTYVSPGKIDSLEIPCNGTYKLEVWGSKGTDYNSSYSGGSGGYSVGTITLEKDIPLYIVAGGITYNGGGSGIYSGGGATHIAYVTGTLASIGYAEAVTNGKVLIVAGGGGGAAYWGTEAGTGGAGGGTSGGGSACSYAYAYAGAAGTQTTGASFGKGADRPTNEYGGAGGGGLYGGFASNYYCGGGGGSGYLSSELSDSSMTNGTNAATGKATITLISIN